MEIEKNDYYVIDGYGKEKFTAEDIGSIHFGYVGSVFFSGLALATGAGIYQIVSGASWNNWYSFFDQPRDTYCISIGRTMWKKYFNKYVTQI